MSVDWGGFGEGLSVGLSRGYVLGEKIAKAMRAHDYEKEQNAINEDYDNRIAQSDAKHAQIKALNEGGDVQRATDEAYKGAIPVAQAGIREIAARDPENGGRWTPTLNDASTYQQTDKAAAMTRHPELQDTAIPRFSRTSADQDRERLNGERKQALMRSDRKYYANDPAMSRQLRKEQEEEDLKQGLLQVYQGALNGDPKYLGILAGAAQQYGLLPPGTHPVPNNDGTFALIDESGHVYTDENGNAYTSVSPNREMIENVFAKFAMQQKMYHDGDFKGMVEERRAAHKEDREDRKVDVQEKYVDGRLSAAQATAQAKALGYARGEWKADGEGRMTLFGLDSQGNKGFPLAHLGEDQQTIIPVNVSDEDWAKMTRDVESRGYQLGVDDKLQPVVMSPDGRSAMSYQGFADRSGTWEPVEGAQSALPANMAGTSAPRSAVQFFDRRQRDTSSPGPMPQAIQRPSAPATQSAEEAPVARAMAVPEGFSKEVPFSGEKGEPAEKARAAALPKYADNDIPASKAKPAQNLGEFAARREEERWQDTSGYNDKQLALINRERQKRGAHLLKAMDKKPEGESFGEFVGRMDKARFSDTSKVSDAGKRAIAASKGEPAPERKAAIDTLRGQAKKELESRKRALPQRQATPAKAPAQKAQPAQETKGEPKLPVKGKVVMKPGDNSVAHVKGANMPSKEYRIQAKRGTRVTAVSNGKVSFSGYMRGYGNVVVVTAKNGENHIYTNVETSLKEGDSVKDGLAIGNAGKQFDYVGYRVDKKGKA